MTVSIIVAKGQGGVRDFADKLAHHFVMEQPVRVLAWQTNSADSIIEQIWDSDCVYLQYSGYGYAKRGAPLWLLREIERNRHKIKKLGIFFHELYAFGPPWGSAFWLSPVQRHIARRLAEMTDFWLTNREDSARWLRRYAGNKPHAVLPVFSNVGEMPAYNPQRSPKIVVFGGAALRRATYRAAGEDLFIWAKRNELKIHDIGPRMADADLESRLIREGVTMHGRLEHHEISELMADAMFGVVTYPVEYVAKSGVFAAYCAYGMCPILISDQYPQADGLIANHHYAPWFDINIRNAATQQIIGEAAWNWYNPHSLNKHLAILQAFWE